MGFTDALNYALFTNPVTTGVASYAWSAASTVTRGLGLTKTVETKMAPPVPLWKLAAATGPFTKFAALSGAVAVLLGAYGAHKQYPEEKQRDLKQVFETANRYHFIHTLAFMGLPLCRARFLSGTFFLSGMVLFCGTCYYYAFTGDKRLSRMTPIGGVCFILGWLCMVV